jgi:hypothetical protein
MLFLVTLGGCEGCEDDLVDSGLVAPVAIVVRGVGTGDAFVTATEELAAVDQDSSPGINCHIRSGEFGHPDDVDDFECAAEFPDANRNGTISLTVTPEPGHTFVRWGGDCAEWTTDVHCHISFTEDDFQNGRADLEATVALDAPHSETLRFASTTTPVGYVNHDFEVEVRLGPDWESRVFQGRVSLPPTGFVDFPAVSTVSFPLLYYWLRLDLRGETTCSVVGNPPSYTVLEVPDPGEIQSVHWQVVCQPPTAAFTIQMNTTGLQPDPDGYELVLDDVGIGTIDTAEIRSFSAAAGTRSLRLADVAPNCIVTAPNPLTFYLAPDTNPTYLISVYCPFDPTGSWTFAYEVTTGTGVCAGTEGEKSQHLITITRSGTTYPYAVTASGFLGNSNNVLQGTLDANNLLTLAGSYPEDGGTTTASYKLQAVSGQTMAGPEDWSWTSPASGSCPDSRSNVIATRQP